MPSYESLLIRKVIEPAGKQAETLDDSSKHLSFPALADLPHLGRREGFKHNRVVKALGFVYRRLVILDFEVQFASDLDHALSLRSDSSKIIDVVQCVHGNDRVKVRVHIGHRLAFSANELHIVVIKWPPGLKIQINQRIETVSRAV
jgi:hypothetical protein